MTVLTATSTAVPAEEYALGMMRAQWDSGAPLRLEPIIDESGLTRREVEAIRDWALSGKKGPPPWERNRGRIPPPKPAPAPAPAPAPPAEDDQRPVITIVPDEVDDLPTVPGYPPLPPFDGTVERTAPGYRWLEAQGHPSPRIATLYEQAVALIGVIEDALDAWHTVDLLRVEESSLLAQLQRVQDKIRAAAGDLIDAEPRPVPELAAPPAAAVEVVGEAIWVCTRCDRVFPTEHGLQVHGGRAHR